MNYSRLNSVFFFRIIEKKHEFNEKKDGRNGIGEINCDRKLKYNEYLLDIIAVQMAIKMSINTALWPMMLFIRICIEIDRFETREKQKNNFENMTRMFGIAV